MNLSIIIVNFNVRFFLEQCLYAVRNAVRDLDAEIIVVDNHSTDGSIEYLQPLFAEVQFVINERNEGFARANNQALRFCKGEYVLFLNPDTLIPENCLQACINYMKANPYTGALGVKMLDGNGRFLPESKRAFPSLMASFYKLSGLAALFPSSPVFNRYALGHLSKDENHDVDVLAGAFFLSRKTLLDELGGFDERFFLYGEDIDLSYRIRVAGWRNHYFAGTEIIHFKGESSDRTKLDQVKFFYRAMQIFVSKHYHAGKKRWFSGFVGTAIFLRGIMAMFARIIKPFLMPLIDGALLFLSLLAVKSIWIYLKRDGVDFHVPFVRYALPLFALSFVLFAAFTGLYDRLYKTSRTVLSVAFAVMGMLAIYSLLPEHIRFSRGVILWGGLTGGLLVVLFRQTLFRKLLSWLGYQREPQGHTLVVAGQEDYRQICAIMENALQEKNVLGRIALHANEPDAICSVEELTTLQKNMPISNIIFCEGERSLSGLLASVKLFSGKDIRMLFHMSGSRSIVGSDTPSSTGMTVGGFIDYRIAQPYQQRMKRMMDIFISLLFLLSFPLQLVLHKNGLGLLKNAWRVLLANRTWIGYLSGKTVPPLRAGIIAHTVATSNFGAEQAEKADRLYAKNYDWWNDLATIFRCYPRLA
jgi:GT2 family glycosyltransferase